MGAKRKWIFSISSCVVLIIIFGSSKQNEFSILKGPYLGQTPPGMTPEIFTPGIVSTGKSEMNAVFSPDGKEFFFARRNGNTLIPMMSPDGKYLFFTSNRRGNGDIYWIDARIIEELKPDELK